jgi:hypothetical protein
MPTLYFRNTTTNKRYKVLKLDKEKNEVVLQGELATFTQPYDKAEFQRLGYVLEREADDT